MQVSISVFGRINFFEYVYAQRMQNKTNHQTGINIRTITLLYSKTINKYENFQHK